MNKRRLGTWSIGAAAVAVLIAGVGGVTAQIAPAQEAGPAPAEAPPPSPADTPPSEALGPAPQLDPMASAIEDALSERTAAAATPAPRPRSQRRERSATGARTGETTGATPVAAPPAARPRFRTATLQGLDKTTARTLRFEARVGVPVRYEGLLITLRACERSAAEEPRREAYAYLDVASQPRQQEGRPQTAPRAVYRGWMLASAPSVHPFGHPIYDLWLVDCSTSTPARRGGA